MNEIVTKNNDFVDIYNRSCRLAAAVFVVSNVMDRDEELKTKIKKSSLELISVSVNLKDKNYLDTRKLITDVEKISLELMSVIDIASVSGLVSKMNGDILKEEFRSFLLELARFSEKSEGNKGVSVKGIFEEADSLSVGNLTNMNANITGNINENYANRQKKMLFAVTGNNNGHKRKNLRKSMILDFVKGHNNVNIKDIVPNITGCSEKTVQRELIALIKEGKIKKVGERRWSRYSIV